MWSIWKGYKTNAATIELNDILPDDVEQKVKEAAEVSMGTEISEEDLSNITNLCDQVSMNDDERRAGSGNYTAQMNTGAGDIGVP